MALNQRRKASTEKMTSMKDLQATMGIKGPGRRPGAGTDKQTLGESLHIGSDTGRRSTKIGRNHLRDSMGI